VSPPLQNDNDDVVDDDDDDENTPKASPLQSQT